MNVLAESTEMCHGRVPLSVAERAHNRASQIVPGITTSGMVRLALAMLAQVPNAEQYGREIPRGPKPRTENIT